MKKQKATFSKPSKADLKSVRAHLRYLNPEDLAKEFRSPSERAAIAAVFKWLSFNHICARSLKRQGHYAVNMRLRKGDMFAEPSAYVIEREQLKRAETVLGIKE